MSSRESLARFSRDLRQAKRRLREERHGGIGRDDGAAVLRMGVVLMIFALVLCAIALIGRS